MEQSKTEKRKILHLSPFFDNSCGVGTVANSLVKQLKKHGHDVDTIEYRPWRDEKKYMYNSKDSTEYFESSKELTEFLKLKEKDYDVLHFHNQIFSNNQNEELFRYFKDKPKLTQVHCVIPYDNKVLKQKSLHNLEELSRQARMINRSDKVVHLTDEVKEIAMKYYGNEHPKDVEVIHNSANQPIKNKNQIKKLRKKLSKNNEKLILYAGRLSEEKGIIELSEGFQKAKEKNPNLKLIICGENRFNEEMNNTIKEKMGKLVEGKDYVFEGRVKQSELANYYSACDLFIQPSRYEHFSVSAIEAFSHKIPVIMSKMDSIKDTFKMDSKDSYVIPIEEINSAEKISEAIIKADSTSKDDLEKIANKAYDFYKTSLTPEKIALQFENAYEDLINKKSLTPSFEESYVIPIGPNDSKENIQETVDSILKKGGDLSNIILTHYDGSNTDLNQERYEEYIKSGKMTILNSEKEITKHKSSSLNKAIAEASKNNSEYLHIILPGHKVNPEEIKERVKILKENENVQISYSSDAEVDLKEIKKGTRNEINQSKTTIKTKGLDILGGFYDSMNYAEDLDFYQKVIDNKGYESIKKANSQKENSKTNSINNKKKYYTIDNLLEITKDVEEFLNKENNNENSKYKKVNSLDEISTESYFLEIDNKNKIRIKNLPNKAVVLESRNKKFVPVVNMASYNKIDLDRKDYFVPTI